MEKLIIQIELKELLNKHIVYDDTHIYELSKEELEMFVEFWLENQNSRNEMKRFEIPKVLLISGTTAFDNTCGECFGEDFDTREQAIQYLHGMSYEEIMELDEIQL